MSPDNIENRSLTIWVGVTWIKFPSDTQGCLPCGVSLKRFISHELMEKEWDEVHHRFIVFRSYTAYDHENHLAILPRYALDRLISELSLYYITPQLIEVEPYPVHPITIKMRSSVELRDNQQEIVDFITNGDGGFKPIALFTGGGKTVTSIYAAAQMNAPILLVLGLLIDQWYKTLLQFTTLRRDEIYVVQGFESLRVLCGMVQQGYQPKVVIFSTRTLSSYCIDPKEQYASLMSYDQLQQRIGFGTLIHDETHLNFYTNTQIDLRTNIRCNIFLSATYQRSDRQGNRIFGTVFPPNMLFGGQFIKRYTVVYMLQYRLGINYETTERFTVAKGYLHAKYEKWLLRHMTFFDRFMRTVIRPVIRKYFDAVKHDDQKLLILCQTKDFVHAVVDYLKKYSEDKVTPYFSGDPKYGSEKCLKTTIIVSTIKSCSTGIDIKGLRTCVNTVSFGSEPQAAQCMGRLRQIPGEETIYVDVWNADVARHQKHQRHRLQVYRQKALKCYQEIIS